MIDIFKSVRDFHEKYEQDVDQPLKAETLELRAGLINEEAQEAFLEMINPSSGEALDPEQVDKRALTKELSDVLYVTVGTAVAWGLPLEEVFKRVHDSNMTKDGGTRSDGKILKGPSYVPPNLDDLF